VPNVTRGDATWVILRHCPPMESVAHSFCQPFDCHTPFSSPFKSHVFHLCPVESQVSNQRPFETQTVPCKSPSRHSAFPSSLFKRPKGTGSIPSSPNNLFTIWLIRRSKDSGRMGTRRERGGDVFVFIEGKQLLLWTPFLVRPLKSRVRSTAVRRCSFSV